MQRLAILWGAALLVAASAPLAPVSAATPDVRPGVGGVTSLALHGQVVVAHPPGRIDAINEVRRVAAARCPGGFLLRSVKTERPDAADFTDHLLNYDAVIDCGGPLSSYGGPN